MGDTQIVWHNLTNDKHYLINGEKGTQFQVEKNGENIKQFSLQLTGNSNFPQRLDYCKINNVAAYLPQQPQALKEQKNQYYTPIIEKFNGYTQFPRQLKQKNNRCFSTCTYFTNTIPQYENKQDLDERIIPIKPQTKLLNNKLNAYRQKERNLNLQKQKLVEQLTNNTDEQYFTQAQDFQTKIEAKKNKTLYFGIDQKDDQEKLYETVTNNKLSQTLTNTFVSQIERKSEFQYKDTKVEQFISSQKLVDKMEKEIKELEGFKVPENIVKTKIQTKNRFNIKIPTNSDQHINFDRKIDKLANPEQYQVKIIKKKKKMIIDPITGKISG